MNPASTASPAQVPAAGGHLPHDGPDDAAGYGDLGARAGRAKRLRTVAVFRSLFTDAQGWQDATLVDQLAAEPRCGQVVAWLIVTGQVRPSVGYLHAGRSRLGAVADEVHPHLSARFAVMSEELGFPPVIGRRQWSALITIASAAGAPPQRLTSDLIAATLSDFHRVGPDRATVRNLSAAAFGMQAVLFHLDLLDRIPARDNGRSGRPATGWGEVAERAPLLAATFEEYLQQMSVRLRPNSLASVDTSLRLFAGYLTQHHHEGHRRHRDPPQPPPGLQDVAGATRGPTRSQAGQPDHPQPPRDTGRVLRRPRRARHRRSARTVPHLPR